MSKFTRVVRFVNGYHAISHSSGQKYKEEHEGTGLFEAPHDHADDFVKAGFAENYADDMDAALEKLTGGEQADKKDAAPAPAEQPQGGKKKL